MRKWKIEITTHTRNCLIALRHHLLRKQMLVLATRRRLLGEQYQPGSFAVDAMHGCKRVDAELPLQSHQQGLLQVASAWCDGQKMRFVDHHQIVVLEQNYFVERDAHFGGNIAVVKEFEMGLVPPIRRDENSLRIDHIATLHARGDFVARHQGKAVCQKINHLRPSTRRKRRQRNATRPHALLCWQHWGTRRMHQALSPGGYATRRPARHHRRRPALSWFREVWYRVQCGCRTQSTRLPSLFPRRATAQNN